VAIATSRPEDHDIAATRWSLDDLARTIVNEAHAQAIHRSTVWRVLDEADLKPHRSVYWLNSHDPDFEAKAKDICRLYVQSPQLQQQGRLVVCTDEKTGMQILERVHATQLAEPGKPEKREQDYIRHGTRVLTATFVAPSGHIIHDLTDTRTSRDFVAHFRHVCRELPGVDLDWVVDGLNTHWSLDLCQAVAEACDVPFDPRQLKRGVDRRRFLSDPTHRPHVFHFTPKHGSWLNQVELWFSVLARRFLARGDFASREEFDRQLEAFLLDYNLHYAHPYRWTYTGTPLVRDTPFSRTRAQARRGRAWFSPRPRLFERVFYPPRRYRRHIAA